MSVPMQVLARVYPHLRMLMGAIFSVLLARELTLSTLAPWLSHGRLVFGLSSTVPEWSSTWALGGARPAEFGAGAWWLLILGGLWGYSVWRAGLSGNPVRRALGLLSTLALTWAVVAVGEPRLLITLAGAHVLTGLLVAYVFRSEQTWTWRHGPGKALILGAVALTGAAIGIQVVWAGVPGTLEGRLGCESFGLILLVPVAVLAARLCRSRVDGLWPVVVTLGVVGTLVWSRDGRFLGEEVRMRWREIPFSLQESHLRRSLSDYRPSERVGAEMRYARPEMATIWDLQPTLVNHARAQGEPILAAWLLLDTAIFRPGSAAEKKNWRESAQAAVADLPEGSRVAVEMQAWLALEMGNVAQSRKYFKARLEADPHSPMLWYGFGCSLAAERQEAAARAAFVNWCLLDPRALFSPIWQRKPLLDLAEGVQSDWHRLVDGPGVSISREMGRLRKFSRWHHAWIKSGGRLADFLSANPECEATDFDATVRQVRSRWRELAANPTDDRSGAFYSAAVALLTDRHVNLGQCMRLQVMAGGETDPLGTGAVAILRTRPLMRAWQAECSYREGAAGAVLQEFEENLMVRLFTYGWDAGLVPVSEDWLRKSLVP